MTSTDEKVKTCFDEIRNRYRELKRGGNVDSSALKEEIRSFINTIASEADGYEELRQEAEDMLIDVTFMIKEDCCSPVRTKCTK